MIVLISELVPYISRELQSFGPILKEKPKIAEIEGVIGRQSQSPSMRPKQFVNLFSK